MKEIIVRELKLTFNTDINTLLKGMNVSNSWLKTLSQRANYDHSGYLLGNGSNDKKSIDWFAGVLANCADIRNLAKAEYMTFFDKVKFGKNHEFSSHAQSTAAKSLTDYKSTKSAITAQLSVGTLAVPFVFAYAVNGQSQMDANQRKAITEVDENFPRQIGRNLFKYHQGINWKYTGEI